MAKHLHTFNKNTYTVYSCGKIYSHTKQKFLKKQKQTSGYDCIAFTCKGDVERWLIHRLIATSFIPNPFNLAEVNHKDGNKQNNDVTNLEWISRKDNAAHAKKIGLFQPIRNKAYKRHAKWIGMQNSSREIIGTTTHEKNGDYKVIVRCTCTNEFEMYFNDFRKDRQKFCTKCRPKSSYSS